MNLTRTDYYNILEYYNLDYNINDTLKQLKNRVEQIIANKLCRCIKKVKTKYNDTDEKRVIAICNNSVIKKKNINIYRFSCKKNHKLLLKKTQKKHNHKIYKTSDLPIKLKPQKYKKKI